jgi:hypothetical protein
MKNVTRCWPPSASPGGRPGGEAGGTGTHSSSRHENYRVHHEMFGIYGQGVSVTTAVLPAGWTARLVPYERADAEPSEAKCLDAHDLVISKLVAGRDKDLLFARVLVEAGLISCATLRDRAQLLEVVPGVIRRVLGYIDRFDPRP